MSSADGDVQPVGATVDLGQVVGVGLSVVTPSVRPMERGWVMATWRTVYCTLCRRERRHFTTAHGEVCSWCGDGRSGEPGARHETARHQAATS